MTITFDKANNRATDDTGGMAVAYIREDYPLERGEFWTLAWKGKEHEFRVDWDDGYLKISRGHPDLSIDETSKRSHDLHLMEYRIPMVMLVNERNFLDNIEGKFLDNIDLFIDLFSTVARNRFHSRNIHVIFKPWSVAEKYHREVHFPPLDVGDAVHGQGGKL
jgi:hypothetical protein